jgi:hypothetical protein
MSKILDKIKKLYDKSLSAKELGNQAEAEAFLAKATELLAEHNLSFSDLKSDEEKEEEIFFDEEQGRHFPLYDKPEQGRWRMDLLATLAKNNFCTCIYRGNGTAYFRGFLIGTPTNIEIVRYLYEISQNLFPELAAQSYTAKVLEIRKEFTYKGVTAADAHSNMIDKIQLELDKISNASLLSAFFSKDPLNQTKIKTFSQALKLKPEDFMPSSYKEDILNKVEQDWILKNVNKLSGLISDRSTYIRNFLLGVPHGISKKMQQQKESFGVREEENNVPQEKTLNALIKVNKQDLEKFIDNKFPNIKSISNASSSIFDKNAFKDGLKSGFDKSFNRGLNTNTTNSKVNLLN